MRYLIVVMALLFSVTINAQDNQNLVNNTSQSLASASTQQNSSYGSTLHVKNPRRRVEGTTYLYDNWNNMAIVHTSDNQRFAVRNVNLNLKLHTFEAKVGMDSIFTFNFNNIKKFVINDDVYKNYYWDDDNKVYQVIYETNDFQLLKGFKVILQEGSANPMLNRMTDKYIRKASYYLRKEDAIKPFRLTKKRILKLVNGDSETADKIENYARNNKLSFKRDNDVQKILEYSAKN
ncbi:MAG: hypothetical protein KJO77_01780 [Bacteroidia bacterium]|nr:hypothetical protein [Bacteroidia bacterium]NND51101.1 hypothetical protein [Flavobacteriaceae bacterium]